MRSLVLASCSFLPRRRANVTLRKLRDDRSFFISGDSMTPAQRLRKKKTIKAQMLRLQASEARTQAEHALTAARTAKAVLKKARKDYKQARRIAKHARRKLKVLVRKLQKMPPGKKIVR